MDKEYSRRELEEFQAEIDTLPIGYISRKKISGKEYFYRQWAENGKTRSQYIKKKDLEQVRSQIARRKELQGILKEAMKNSGVAAKGSGRRQMPFWQQMPEFETSVQTGELLDRMVAGVSGYTKRQLVMELTKYLRDQMDNRICLLFGLRRTGKSTIMLQAIAGFTEKDRGRTAYIRVTASDGKQALLRDIQKLAAMGYRYLFLDELTVWNDFAETVEMLSDVYGGMGVKMVVSGMNPAGVARAVKSSLYDRALVLHTTEITYKEYCWLLGETGMETYLQCGGMLQRGNVWGEEANMALPEEQFIQTYMENVICQNMGQEQTDVICEKIHEMNEARILSMFSHDFKLYNWEEAAKKRRGGRPLEPEEHRQAVQYLEELDLYETYPFVHIKDDNRTEYKEVFTLPWISFAQSRMLLNAMMEDLYFAGLSERDKGLIRRRMMTEIMGRMMAEIVMVETRRARREDVGVCRLDIGGEAWNMLIYDTRSDECWMYMVLYEEEPDAMLEEQLLDGQRRRVVERQYGRIIDRCILYLGKEQWRDNGIHYKNAARYLCDLHL